MSTTDPKVHLYWMVRCFHRQDRSCFDRHLTLDWSRLTPDQQAHVLRLSGQRPTPPAILQYRHLFEERPVDQSGGSVDASERFEVITLNEYFEDETGQPMDLIGLMQAVSGQEDPIIVGNPRSVLRLGPCPIRNRDKWSPTAANDIAHFLSLVRQLAASEWLATPLSLRYTPGAGGVKRALSLDAPDLEATRAVLLLIRQFVSSDEAFNHACNRYLAHAGDDRKRFWVRERQQSFKACRESAPFLPFLPSGLRNITRQQVIDLFLYGSGLVHRQSKHNLEPHFARAVAEFGREHVVLAFNGCCLELSRYAFDVYHVIEQDFTHWLDHEGCDQPDRIDIRTILG